MFPEGGSNIQDLLECLTFEPTDLLCSISFNVYVFVFMDTNTMFKSKFDDVNIVVVDIVCTVSLENMKKLCWPGLLELLILLYDKKS